MPSTSLAADTAAWRSLLSWMADDSCGRGSPHRGWSSSSAPASDCGTRGRSPRAGSRSRGSTQSTRLAIATPWGESAAMRSALSSATSGSCSSGTTREATSPMRLASRASISRPLRISSKTCAAPSLALASRRSGSRCPRPRDRDAVPALPFFLAAPVPPRAEGARARGE